MTWSISPRIELVFFCSPVKNITSIKNLLSLNINVKKRVFCVQNILLQDRVAFACMFLPDSKLNNFISSLAVDLVKNGVLEGAMVVGLTTKIGLDLLQNYVDKVWLSTMLFFVHCENVCKMCASYQALIFMCTV